MPKIKSEKMSNAKKTPFVLEPHSHDNAETLRVNSSSVIPPLIIHSGILAKKTLVIYGDV